MISLIQAAFVLALIAVAWQAIVWAVALPFRLLGRAIDRWDTRRVVAEYDRQNTEKPRPTRR